MVFVEYKNPTTSGHVVLVVKSGGNKRRSIVETILDLRTSVKVVEQRAKKLGRGSGTYRDIRHEEGSYHQRVATCENSCPTTLGKGNEATM
jgi:hypothetical protein